MSENREQLFFMKHFFYGLFIALALVSSSCNKDNNKEEEKVENSGLLAGFNSGDFTVGKNFPRKITTEGYGHKSVTQYEVVNGRVTKRNYNGKSDFSYVYDGKFLKAIKYASGEIYNEFWYSNGRVSKVYDDKEGTFEYIYDTKGRVVQKVRNLNGSISNREYRYIDANTVQIGGEGGTTYTYANGNLIKEDNKAGTITYEYDNKNNFNYKNNFVMTSEGTGLGTLFGIEYSKNNVTKAFVKGKKENKKPGEYYYEDAIVTFEYEYNTDGYPTKVKGFKNGELQETITYEY